MQVLAIVSFLVASVSGWVVGLRLLAAARRNRQVPELAIGTATLTQAIAAALMLWGARVAEPGTAAAGAGYAGGLLVALLGNGMLGIGLWQIFRPTSALAPLMVALLCLEMTAGWLWLALSSDPYHGATKEAGGLILYLGRAAFFAWASFECLHYHGKLRRRMRLGLADPVITHQIALWGVSALAMTAMFSVSLVTQFVLAKPVFEWSPSLFATSVLGLVGSVGIWLAFYPPEAYRRRIAARRGAGEATPESAFSG